jgi:transposase
VTKRTDIAEIRSLLTSMLAADKTDDALDLVTTMLVALQEDNDRLQARIARLLKDRFGRRSEKIPAAQLALFLEASEAIPETVEMRVPVPAHTRKKTPHGRKPLPAHLPREVVVLEPAAELLTCAVCGTAKTCIGHETSEVLEFEPGHFKVLVYERAKYACRPCGGEVVIGPTGDRPLDSGLPGYGLLADVLVRKYAEHMPLHRLRGSYARLGVELPVSTLADWVAGGTDQLDPLAHAVWARTFTSHVLQADDTGITVLDDQKPGGSKRGHIWCYLGDQRWASYVYTPTWSGDGPCSFLKGRRGWVQADAYAGYDALFNQPASAAREVGCWAHARRRFVKALDRDKRAAFAVQRIGELYAIDRDAKERGLDAAGRHALRADRAPPILDSLKTSIEEIRPQTLPKSELGGALTYALNQWTPLQRVFEDGALELDNNACERALRPVAVGRKSWMFAGSDDGAVRAATLYTLLGTCRLHGVEPVAYLKDVLRKLAGGWKQNRIDELLPPRWQELHAPPQPVAASA